jgi:hypothetical protein
VKGNGPRFLISKEGQDILRKTRQPYPKSVGSSCNRNNYGQSLWTRSHLWEGLVLHSSGSRKAPISGGKQ